MIQCPQCGHHNLPSFPTCSKCGAIVATGAPSSGLPLGPSQDPPPPFAPTGEFSALMAKREAVQKRNRAVYGLVGVAVMAGLAFMWVSDSQKKASVQAKLEFAEKWIDLDKRETGAFWACVMASEVDVGMFTAAAQIQGRIEGAYATQPKTYSEHLTTECVPKIERARQAFGGLSEVPPEFSGPLEAYRASLPKLESGIEEYAQKIKGRQGMKDTDLLIQEYGNAWHAGGAPTPEAVAFEKFLHCAMPELASLKDTQALLEHMADLCFKKDPVAFMDRARSACGPLLQQVDARATPSKTWKLTQKKFLEDDARMLQAWESCSKRSRKGKKVEDLEAFLLAVGDYMKARADFAGAAKDLTATAE
jgi:hypothetical protein